jgi:hypothetical protein
MENRGIVLEDYFENIFEEDSGNCSYTWSNTMSMCSKPFIYMASGNRPCLNTITVVNLDVLEFFPERFICFEYHENGYVQKKTDKLMPVKWDSDYEWSSSIWNQDIIAFRVEGYDVAYYFPKTNFLAMSSFFNDNRYCRMFETILHYLIDKDIMNKCEREERQANCTIGADPEFEVLYNGDVLNMRSAPRRIVDRMTAIADGEDCTNASIGLDGSGQQVELRFEASTNIDSVISNMTKLFKKLNKKIYHFSTIGNVYPLGGHIHFGVGYSYNPSGNCRKILDYFIGKKFQNLNGGSRGNYAQLAETHSGGIETKPWGFEYRCAPAAIFHNPAITKSVCKLAKGIMDDFLSGKTIELSRSWRNCKQWLTKDEWNVYFKFNDFYKKNVTYDDNVIAFWLNNPELQKTQSVRVEEPKKANVVFNDSWSAISKKMFMNYLETHYEDFYTFNLFGLKSERGDVVSGLTIDGWETIEWATQSMGNTIILGIPFAIRSSRSFYYIKNFLEKMIITDVCRTSIELIQHPND